MDAVCKGSWMLGTACGHCSRCVEMAKPTIDALLADIDEKKARMSTILSCLPPGGHGFDISDEFKVKCFDEARRLVAAPWKGRRS
jgi:hypothetical protein